MPAINFSPQFAGPVETGTKRRTIRRVRKHPIKVGDMLHLYTGMRTANCRKLRTATCLRVTPILIDEDRVMLGGKLLGYEMRVALAESDGFRHTGDFTAWFRDHYGLPFEGVMIQW